jgi:hypothetical protein
MTWGDGVVCASSASAARRRRIARWFNEPLSVISPASSDGGSLRPATGTTDALGRSADRESPPRRRRSASAHEHVGMCRGGREHVGVRNGPAARETLVDRENDARHLPGAIVRRELVERGRYRAPSEIPARRRADVTMRRTRRLRVKRARRSRRGRRRRASYSSRVVTSPRSWPVSCALSRRRMILPLRVFGSFAVKRIADGVAIGPSSWRTCATSSAANASEAS